MTSPTPDRDYVMRHSEADGFIAALLRRPGTALRAALDELIPKDSGGGTLPAGLVTAVTQRTDGTWPNPVRTGTGQRRWHGLPEKPLPRSADGLRAGDELLTVGELWRVMTADAAQTSWQVMLSATRTPGSVVVTGQTETAPPAPDPAPTPSTPAPAMTVRPYTILESTGSWASTGSTSIVEALSDQHITGVTARPTAAGGGVSIRTGVPPLLLEKDHDVLVTLWDMKAPTAGEVTVTLTRNGAQIGSPIRQPVGLGDPRVDGRFRWLRADLPIIASWENLAVQVTRPGGGLDMMDITVQSVPPATQDEGPGREDPTAATAFGGVFGSNLRAAPRSIYTDAKRAHIAAAGQIILGAYDDAPMVVRAESTTPRVKVTTTVAGGNTAAGTGWADSVPIPAGTRAPSNRWKTLVVVSPSTGEVWEFVEVTLTGSTWACTRGGKISNQTASRGVMPTGTGITGSGLALAAPRITLDEARRAARGDLAAIPHTLGLNLPSAHYAQTFFTTPATRTDGGLSATTEEAARKTVPLTGDRVRLRGDFNTSNMTGLARAIAEALKVFGAVIVGGSPKASIICESGEVEQAASGIDPWGAILAGVGVDQLLSAIKAADLEFVPAGWLSSSSVVNESPMSSAPVVTPVTPPTTPPAGGTTSARIQINLPQGVAWASGASCRGIENSSEGMGSAYAQWRGDPCYFGRTWWDQPGAEPVHTLHARWGNWHAPIDCGPGFFYKGETMAQAAAGSFVSRWRAHLLQARQWWTSRRDPQRMQIFMSPAHEMNGSWYAWSVNRDNVTQFVEAWKRYREVQLQVFPECILTFNLNRDSSFYAGTVNSSGKGMDWREMVPGVKHGGGKITDWVDCMSVDAYNMDPHIKTQAEWDNLSLTYDSYGAPNGVERHRQFAQAQGLALTMPEWSGKGYVGDYPAYADAMNGWFRRNAGTGPGKIAAEALFNLSTGYPTGQFAVMGDTVTQPQFAARYRALTWGR